MFEKLWVTLQVRHPERSAGSPEIGTVLNEEQILEIIRAESPTL